MKYVLTFKNYKIIKKNICLQIVEDRCFLNFSNNKKRSRLPWIFFIFYSQTNSKIAISAASPLLGPFLRILV